MGHMDRNVDQKYQKYATAKENTRKNKTYVHDHDEQK